MDFYAVLGLDAGRERRGRSSGRTGGWRGGITRASTRATARPKRCFSGSPKRTRRWSIRERRRQYDAAAGGPSAGGGDAVVRVRRVRFLGRGARRRRRRRSASCSPRCCIRSARRTRGTPEAGRGPARDAHGRRSRRRCAASSGRSSVTRQDVVRARAAAPGSVRDAGGALRAVPRRPAACAGRAATWCSRSRARRAAAAGRQRRSACAVCGGQGRDGAQRGGRRRGARRASLDGARLRVPETGHAGPARRPRRRSLRRRPRRSRTRCSAARATICICVVPVAVHEAVLGARDRGAVARRPGQAADSAGHAGRPALPRQRPRRADAGRRPRRSGGRGRGWCCRACVDERSKELMREFGRRQQRRRQERARRAT